MFGITTKKVNFPEMFANLVATISEGALLLTRIVQDDHDREARVRELKATEHRGDDITHSIYSELNRALITPYDREDMHMFASSLDDVLDFANSAGQIMVTYHIADATPPSAALAAIIVRQCEYLAKAVSAMDHGRDALEYCAAIERLEREADDVTRQALANLFEFETDPIQLIKLRDLYRLLERATDKAVDASDMIETIVLKST